MVLKWFSTLNDNAIPVAKSRMQIAFVFQYALRSVSYTSWYLSATELILHKKNALLFLHPGKL